jgi:hypothetical protein
MDETKRPQPRNIFEVINLNIIDLSQDMALLYKEIHEIHSVLFPQTATSEQASTAEPTESGTTTNDKK